MADHPEKLYYRKLLSTLLPHIPASAAYSEITLEFTYYDALPTARTVKAIHPAVCDTSHDVYRGPNNNMYLYLQTPTLTRIPWLSGLRVYVL
jgi:hypothetical protein